MTMFGNQTELPASEMHAPAKLKGTELEREILHVVKSSDDVTGNRYGVMTSVKPDGELIRIKSYPDIEGVIKPEGRQWLIECKSCSAASLHLASRLYDDKQTKQLRHLLNRAEFGAISMYVIHFNRRELKTKTIEQETFAMPVHPCHPFWIRFLSGLESKVNIDICLKYGTSIEWVVPYRCKNARINIVPTIMEVDDMIRPHRQSAPTGSWRDSMIFRIDRKQTA